MKVVGGVRNQMRETDPIQDAFSRFEDTDSHGSPDRKNTIGTPKFGWGISFGGRCDRFCGEEWHVARFGQPFQWATHEYSGGNTN
jgi:hypothetical protein